MRKLILGIAVGCALASAASAQTDSSAPGSPSPPGSSASTECCTIPALTEVKIEIGATINSQANKIGEHFPIRLAEPIVIEGKTLVPAGTTGQGDIVHAAKSRFGGRAGELILAVRYLDYNGIRIPLRSLRYIVGHGKTNEGKAAAAAIVIGGAVGATLAMFITGGEVNVPAGTHALAKTSAPVVIPQSSVIPTPQQEGSPPK